MAKKIILTLGFLVFANNLQIFDAQHTTNLDCQSCDKSASNELHNESVDRIVTANRSPRSVTTDSGDSLSGSQCLGNINVLQGGFCVEAKKCLEAFEAPIESCNNRGHRQAVCCFNNSLTDESKSTPRGLEELAERRQAQINNFQIPSESGSTDTTVFGYSLEQHNQFASAMQAISESVETGNSGSKQQLLNMNISAATSQMPKFGYTDSGLVNGIRYLDAMQYFLSERSNSSLGPMIRNKAHQLSEYKLNFVCQPEPKCDGAAPYRALDGSCNNLEYPSLGSSNTGYDRLLLPYYDDGFQALREKGVNGNALPGAREVSVISFGLLDSQSKVISQMGVFFGQFIAHDMSSAALESLSFNPFSPIDCCKHDADKHHFDCAPIQVPALDPFYGLFKKCLNFVRNIQAPPTASNCVLGARQQLSGVTHWLDLSVVYGNSVEDSRKMRDPNNSALLVSSSDKADKPAVKGHTCMPHDTKGFKDVGDGRANQSPMLSVIQIVFFRLHNKLVVALSQLNPHWSSERLFEEARRINIAIYQSIVYKEFMPVLVGKQVLKQFTIDMVDTNKGHTESYDAQLRYGGTLNEYAHGAYRLHNLIWGLFQTKSDSGMLTRVPTPVWLLFQQGQLVCKRHLFKGTLNAMLLDGGGNWDENMPDDIHGRLFQTPLQMVGHDLLSLDIQRGRDHGLPTYTKVREACGLGKLHRWSQLDSILQLGAGIKLRLIYSDIQDIDLVVGGQLELAMEGATVGPTFACLIAEQMRRTRYGDRYFFDNRLQPAPFSQQQLAVIHEQVSLASVLCHTTELKQSQPNVFGVVSKDDDKNSLRDCKHYPFMKLDAWRESGPASPDTAPLAGTPVGAVQRTVVRRPRGQRQRQRQGQRPQQRQNVRSRVQVSKHDQSATK